MPRLVPSFIWGLIHKMDMLYSIHFWWKTYAVDWIQTAQTHHLLSNPFQFLPYKTSKWDQLHKYRSSSIVQPGFDNICKVGNLILSYIMDGGNFMTKYANAHQREPMTSVLVCWHAIHQRDDNRGNHWDQNELVLVYIHISSSSWSSSICSMVTSSKQ